MLQWTSSKYVLKQTKVKRKYNCERERERSGPNPIVATTSIITAMRMRAHKKKEHLAQRRPGGGVSLGVSVMIELVFLFRRGEGVRV